MLRRLLGTVLAVLCAVALLATPAAATSAIEHDQGFERDPSGWFDAADSWHGRIVQVDSGDDGISSADGAGHAEVSADGTSGPYSAFGRYADRFPGTFTTELDVHLDPAWAVGSGFDYSVAANGSDGTKRRDYVFHVARDTSSGALLVAASNSTSFVVREDLDIVANSVEISEAGWYTLRHRFRDDDGYLTVDMELVDRTGTVLLSESRGRFFGGEDPISEVGGNRYGWFTVISRDLSVAVDNQQLCLGPSCPRNVS